MDSLNTSENKRGQYANQFQVTAHDSNRKFALNPYVQKRSPMVCFSLTDGANYVYTHNYYTIGGDYVMTDTPNKQKSQSQAKSNPKTSTVLDTIGDFFGF